MGADPSILVPSGCMVRKAASCMRERISTTDGYPHGRSGHGIGSRGASGVLRMARPMSSLAVSQ
jgi:hypothetical protein